jgi:hypothetical protein
MGRNAQYLSEEEISGNLYLFTVAGMDTTANSLAYALTVVAIYPEWQQWIFEELDVVLKEGNILDYDYAVIFPKLTRCLALMVRMRNYTAEKLLRLCSMKSSGYILPSCILAGRPTQTKQSRVVRKLITYLQTQKFISTTPHCTRIRNTGVQIPSNSNLLGGSWKARQSVTGV